MLDKSKILQIYTKHFNGWVHLVIMPYAVIMRFDSLREITASLLAEARKLGHLNYPEKDWEAILKLVADEPPQPSLFG